MTNHMTDEHDYHTMLKLPARMLPRQRKNLPSYEAHTLRELDKRLASEIAQALVYLPKFDTTPEECKKFRRDNKEQLRKHIEWGLSQEHIVFVKHFSDTLLDRCVEMEIALSDVRNKMKKFVDLNLPNWKAAFSYRCRGWGGRPGEASSIFINFYPDCLEPTLEQAFASHADFLGTSDQAMSVLNHFEDVVKILNPDRYNGVVRKAEMEAERRTIMRVRYTANSATAAAKQAFENANMWLARDKKWAVKWLKEQQKREADVRDDRMKKAREADDALDKVVSEFVDKWGESP
tara:strand:- start:12487 stop:13359 length:873 start_codon:yes stop_codon:yes gene_type:complete